MKKKYVFRDGFLYEAIVLPTLEEMIEELEELWRIEKEYNQRPRLKKKRRKKKTKARRKK